jgi:hypothetical protein
MNKITVDYRISVNQSYYNYEFTEDEKRILRPIAETLAMIDGNAFLTLMTTDDKEWYEQYLPEAMSIFIANGGYNGWASEVSWIQDLKQETPEVKEAYQHYKTLKALSK